MKRAKSKWKGFWRSLGKASGLAATRVGSLGTGIRSARRRFISVLRSNHRSGGPRASLSGDLSMMGVVEIVQALHHGKKTGLLQLRKGDEEGDVYFVEGQVRHARVADPGGGSEKSGEEALYQIMDWADGSFVFEAGSRDIKHVISGATMGLLMEGMRRRDEAPADAGRGDAGPT
jgi:hypothetical protein